MDCLSSHIPGDFCSPGCMGNWKGDGTCQPGCMTSDCNWDDQDCCGKKVTVQHNATNTKT